MMKEWRAGPDVIGCTVHPLLPQDFPRASGNLLVVRDVQHKTSLLLKLHVFIIIRILIIER